MDKRALKQQVVDAGLELLAAGLTARTWGNVSCRLDEETFAITPSGRGYDTLTAEEIVEVKLKDLGYEGQLKPSSEKRIHAEIYKRYKNICFIIHTHQENASVISATGLSELPLREEYEGLGRSVVCAKYALPGTKSLCKNTLEAIGKSGGKAVILKHHGAICLGGDYKEAFFVAGQLEKAASAYLTQMGIKRATGTEREDDGVISALLKALPSKKAYLFNEAADVASFSKLGKVQYPYLDDFAQIVGTRIDNVDVTDRKNIAAALKKADAVYLKGRGALCVGKNEADALAVSMILEKNCKAYFAAYALGQKKAIKPLECMIMRRIYIQKYSKLKGGSEQ